MCTVSVIVVEISLLQSIINLAKQCGQSASCFCFSSGICRHSLKNRHHTSIISVLALSILPPFIITREASEVAKNVVSLLNSISLLIKLFGAGKWTVSPSNNCKKSPHAIIDGCQRKSLRITTSAFSAPTQANVPVAGFIKALYRTFNGLMINVFPVFAGPYT